MKLIVWVAPSKKEQPNDSTIYPTLFVANRILRSQR